MNQVQAKEAVKDRLEEYLNIITTKKGKHYICPVCGSGKGQNKTPAGQLNPDGQTYHCFSCSFHGDIFNLVGQIEGITEKTKQFKRVYEMFNIQTKPARADERAQTKKTPKTDYITYFKECHARAGKTDYFTYRGLNKATIDKFMLGYDPQWRSPKALSEGKKTPTSARIIIPTGKQSYVARATEPNADPKYKAIKEGTSEIFNKKALQGTEPIFVVEGEIDALSVIEVGGQSLALGSVSNKRKFIELCRAAPPKSLLILSLDNDEAGQKTQSEITEALKGLEIAYIEANISGEYKDPNEHLTGDFEAFRGVISDYIQAVKDETETAKEKYIKEMSVMGKIDEFVGQIKASVDTPAIPTNFCELDKVLDDGLYEGLYIIGAISSLGKTSFVLQIADQIAQEGQDVLIFSLEMATSELMAKTISRITFLKCGDSPDNAKTTRGITSGKRHANYSKDEKALINESIQEYASYTEHLYIYEGAGDIGVSQVREITERHIKATGNKPVVVIDYLQILAPYEPKATDKQNTDKAVFELKRLSRDMKIPVIGISSLNRDNYNTAISMAAFKESGAIEYSSDVLIGLQFAAMGDNLEENGVKVTSESINRMKRENTRKIELKILKNRNGVAGDSIIYKYYPMFNCFHETGKKTVEDNELKGKRR